MEITLNKIAQSRYIAHYQDFLLIIVSKLISNTSKFALKVMLENSIHEFLCINDSNINHVQSLLYYTSWNCFQPFIFIT